MTMRTVFLLGGLILTPALATAQFIEVFATTGVVQVWDDEGKIGVGTPVGGGVGFRSPHGWGVEGLAEVQNAERKFDSEVRFDSKVTAARVRIIKYFTSGRTQPYAGGGVGVTRVKSIREFPTGCAFANNVFTCTGRDIFRSEATNGTLSGFAGVRFAAGRVLFVRPEFEVSKAGEHMRIGGTVAVGASW